MINLVASFSSYWPFLLSSLMATIIQALPIIIVIDPHPGPSNLIRATAVHPPHICQSFPL